MSELDAGPDTIMCPNDTVQLFPTVTASCGGRGKYKWTPSQYFVNDSIQSPLVSVPQTTVVTVTFSDSCGCVMKDSLTVFADSLKLPNMVNTNPDCGASNGEIEVVPVGGWGPYTYSIDSGKNYYNVSEFKGLSVGFYDLGVIDSIGCVSPIVPDTLFNKGAPKIDRIETKDISCKSFADGEIEVFTSGGTIGVPLLYSVDSMNNWGNSSILPI